MRLDVSFRTFVQGDLSIGEFCRQMKGIADSVGDLGWPMEDRILVLNVFRVLSDRYAHLRTWITRQRPFHTFLQVRDDLVMEELTQGPPAWVHLRAGVLVFLDCPCRYSSTASGRSATVVSSWSSSSRAERGWGAVVAAVAAEGDVERVLAVGATRRRLLHGPHSGPLSTTRGQGASPCGLSRLLAVSLARRQPSSLVLLRGFPQRLRGLHLPVPRPSLSVGTRRLWPAPSALWP